MTTTNPQGTGTTENTNSQSLALADTAIGFPEQSVKFAASGTTGADLAVGQELQLVDGVIGTDIEGPNVNAFVAQKTKSKPSGYNADGVPTYGDGYALTYSFSSDDEVTGAGEFSYVVPSGVNTGNYADLT